MVYTVIIVLYFLMVIGVSFFTRKIASRSSAEYLVAGRNLGTLICAVVVSAEWLGGMSTIGVSEKAFKTGTLQPILYNFSTALGMIIIGFTVAAYYREKQVHTVSEMLEHLFGRKTKMVSAIAFLIAYITLAFVQLQTCASVIAPLFHIRWEYAVILSSAIITVYTYVGGMHAIALTSIIHLFVMYLGVGIAMVIGIDHAGGWNSLGHLLIQTGAPDNFLNPFSVDITYALSLLVGGVLGGMAGQASIQPIFSAKDIQTAKKAAVLSGLIVAPFGIMTAILGLVARTGLFMNPEKVNPKEVLGLLLTNPQFIHPVLGGLALAGVLAAILSTVGPVNFAVVTIATRDIYIGFLRKDADERKIVATARNLVILVSLVTIPMAIIFQSGILDMAYVSYAIRAIGAIVVVTGIYLKGWIRPLAVKLSFIGGTVVIFICMIAAKLHWFVIDKTLAAVVAALIFILTGNIIAAIRGEKA